MENFKKLLKLAEKLESKYVVAQQATAQSGDVEKVLKAAGAWDLSNQVSPLLEAAKVPSDASVDIKINVNSKNQVSFTVLLNPTNPKASQTLSLLLMKNFSKKMSDALRASGANIGDSVILNWLTF